MQIFRVLVVVLAFGLASVVRGGDIPCAGSITNRTTMESHGWAADTTRLGATRILHLPPRGADSHNRRGASDGAMRVATRLAQRPEALAAINNRLYMAFPPTASGRGGQVRRQVLSIDAERGTLDGSWVSEGESSGARLPVLASLPGDGDLRGFVGSPVGPVALIDRPGFDGIPVEELLLLKDGAWVSLPLPQGLDQRTFDGERLDNSRTGVQDTGIRLTAEADGISLTLIDVEQPGTWSLKLDGSPQPAAWKWEKLAFGSAHGRIRPSGSVYRVQGQLVVEQRHFDQVELWIPEALTCRKLATVSGVPEGYGVVPLDQTGRIAVIWWPAPTTPGGSGLSLSTTESRPRIVEVSVLTGQLLFDGEADNQLPFSSTEVKILAVFLVIGMLTIVVFVLRPDKPGPPLTLPKGVFLTDPNRRMVAGAIDAAIAVVIASQVTGFRWADLSDFETVLKEMHIVWLWLATTGIGLLCGTLTEWLFGRTAGKALAGCEVVRAKVATSSTGQVTIDVVRPELWRAAVRNLVKWLVPPVAISGVSSIERRHRGDMAAGTVVVMREDPDAPEET